MNRIPVLCGAMGMAASLLKARTRLRAFDPALCYVMHARELRGFEPGTMVVDLTHVPSPTTKAAWGLRDLMERMRLEPIPLDQLHGLVRAWHSVHRSTFAPIGFTADPGPADG